MAPTDNLISALGGVNNTIADVVNYYGNCEPGASSSIQSNVNDIILQMNKTEEVLYNLTSFIDLNNTECFSHIDLITGNLSLTTDHIETIVNLIRCEVLYPAWFHVVDVGFCTDLFGGFFILWVCQFATSGALFIVMCIASVMFLQYEAPVDPEYTEGNSYELPNPEEVDEKFKGDVEMVGDYDNPAAENYHELERGGPVLLD
jgi:hypothetical protein